MPTYEYLCGSCGHNFEQVQKISEDALVTCPQCGKNELKRLVNAAAFHLKGGGWYKTDYASSSSSSQASSSSSSASTTSSSDKASTTSSTATSCSGDSTKCSKCN